MRVSKSIFLLFFFLLISFKAYPFNALQKAYEGLDIGYRYINTNQYYSHKITAEGLHTSTPNQFGYEFSQVLGSDTLTHIGITYAYKAGSHWAGFGISSSSNKPFTSLNVIDFDVFYAFRIFQHVTEYETKNGESIAYYSRLYLGVEYSTSRNYLDGFPMPVIRYEYHKPKVNVVFGLPLTYIKMDFFQYSSIEIEYIPLIDIFFSYNLGFNNSNILSFQVIMENDVYKLTSIVQDVYFSQQEKYYIDQASIRLKYNLIIKDLVKISPYVDFIIDSHKYVAKAINWPASKNLETGYSIGIEVSAFF